MTDSQPRFVTLADADWKFPQATKPTKFYMIAFSPRSASSFLCNQLWRTGVLGAPEEYFDYMKIMPLQTCRLRTESLLDYLNALFRLRTSPNGVFGFKAHARQYQFMKLAYLMRYFPGLRFIHLERKRKLAQAVSFAKAMQTRKWHSTSVAEAEPVYDFNLIRDCLKTIREFDKWWENFFTANRIRPYRVVHEDLVSEHLRIVKEILKFLEVAPDPAAAKGFSQVPQLESVSDSTNVEWLERFRNEAQKHGVRIPRERN